MIRHISIKNFATIEKTSIDFEDGLNIITGETGAGKSIVIEAVSLALGSRADTAFVRSGTDKAIVQMVADYNGEEYIITREISAAGKNICRVNDEIVTLSHLNGICKKLADIHGQYDHQSLLNPDYHIKLVDLYNSKEIGPALEEVGVAHDGYVSVRRKLKQLTEQENNDKRERDFMEFELWELEDANLQIGEDEQLEERISILQNSEKIYRNLAESYEAASDSEYSVLSALQKIAQMIDETSSYSSDLAELASRVNEIYYDFEDVCSSIRSSRDDTVFSPAELDAAIERIELLNQLKHKHGMTIEELIAYKDELNDKLAMIDSIDDVKESLKSDLAKWKEELISTSNKLSILRREAAKELETKITYELAQLNFKNAEFSIEFKPSEVFTHSGMDDVEFMISTNRGEVLKPLSKIASGGEMSRIMLAFKKIIGDYDQIPTMIFDEIDSGISGIAASVVGGKLKEIASTHQIICITHLPQIAAYGEHNYKIEKNSDDTMTYTQVTPLTEDEKIHEIARLLGGTNITDTTLKSAKELIDVSI